MTGRALALSERCYVTAMRIVNVWCCSYLPDLVRKPSGAPGSGGLTSAAKWSPIVNPNTVIEGCRRCFLANSDGSETLHTCARAYNSVSPPSLAGGRGTSLPDASVSFELPNVCMTIFNTCVPTDTRLESGFRCPRPLFVMQQNGSTSSSGILAAEISNVTTIIDRFVTMLELRESHLVVDGLERGVNRSFSRLAALNLEILDSVTVMNGANLVFPLSRSFYGGLRWKVMAGSSLSVRAEDQ
jgi:hypothetical protein